MPNGKRKTNFVVFSLFLGYDVIAMEIPIRRRWFEIGAVALTAVLKFVMVDGLNLRPIFIPLVIGGWLSYLIYRVRKDKGILAYWGFTTKNLRTSFAFTFLMGIVGFLGMASYAYIHDQFVFNWPLLLSLLLYPLWGWIQHLLTMGLVAGNLHDMPNAWPKVAIILFTATVFALVHLPNLYLAGATFLLALFYVIIYLKWRNLWPLGLFHGWLGALFYYWVLNQDPWQQILG